MIPTPEPNPPSIAPELYEELAPHLPKEQRRLRQGERDRNRLDDFTDEDLDWASARARKLLPDLAGDASFDSIIRRIWRSHGDALPDDLASKYRTLRAEVAWLEDGMRIEGEMPMGGLLELARMLTELQVRHHHLAGNSCARLLS